MVVPYNYNQSQTKLRNHRASTTPPNPLHRTNPLRQSGRGLCFSSKSHKQAAHLNLLASITYNHKYLLVSFLAWTHAGNQNWCWKRGTYQSGESFSRPITRHRRFGLQPILNAAARSDDIKELLWVFDGGTAFESDKLRPVYWWAI